MKRDGAMFAIDTNIVVRLITQDDLDQNARVERLLTDHDVLVDSTVLMESDWVLRSVYKLESDQAVSALKAFVSLPRVTLREPSRVAQALDWAAQGMDFADALHLAGAEDCEAFVTFDRRLAKTSADIGAPAVGEP